MHSASRGKNNTARSLGWVNKKAHAADLLTQGLRATAMGV